MKPKHIPRHAIDRTTAPRTEAANHPPSSCFPPPPPLYSGSWRATFHLARLSIEVRRYGWTTQLRITGPRPLLRVFSEIAPAIGESVSVIWGNGTWWYQSSTGLWLARCAETRPAAEMLNIVLAPWVTAASAAHQNDQC